MNQVAVVFGLFGLAAAVVPQGGPPREPEPVRAQEPRPPMTADDLAQSLTKTGRADVRTPLFAAGATTMMPESKALIAAIAQVLKQQPEWKLAIRAYAGAPGAAGSAAQTHAKTQAAAVRTALIETFAIAPDRLVAEAYPEVVPGRPDAAPAPTTGARFELVRIAAKTAPPPAANGTAGEWTGRITSGLMAVGGETTGISIVAGQERFELQGADQTLRQRLQELSGKTVTIRGTLVTRPGVEVRVRRIITVTEIIETPAPSSGR